MGKVRWIIFDLGGVVIDYRHPVMLARLAEACGLSVQELREVLHRDFLDERFGRGEISEAEFARVLAGACERALTQDTVRDCLNAGIFGEFAPMRALIESLKEFAPLACLSNTNETHWRCVQACAPVMAHFARTFASHELGLLKPHREIFDCVGTALGIEDHLPPVLIDDLAANVAGARAAGWEAIHYEGQVDVLRRQIESFLSRGAD